jgi:hypothetical protein
MLGVTLTAASPPDKGYNLDMTVPATTRLSRTFEDRGEALSHFFSRAAEAPRLLAFDDAVGCPLDQALAAVEWTQAAGILNDDDLMHAAWIRPDAAAAVVERRDGDRRLFAYFGPRMDQPYADLAESELLYDGPGVRAYAFADRAQAIGHFLRATQGVGAMLSLLGRRAPELRHVRRWLKELFASPPATPGSTLLMAGWFATTGAGCLFLPVEMSGAFCYREVGVDS